MVEMLRIFVCHSFRHDNDRQEFHCHLGAAWPKGLIYVVLEPSKRHHSIRLTTSEIRKVLRELIAKADVVIVVAAMCGARSEWMKAEIKIAGELGKPIILVARKRAQGFPKSLCELAMANPVPIESIRSAIVRKLPAHRKRNLRTLEVALACRLGAWFDQFAA
jgi:hypothetical protein